MLNCDNLRHP